MCITCNSMPQSVFFIYLKTDFSLPVIKFFCSLPVPYLCSIPSYLTQIYLYFFKILVKWEDNIPSLDMRKLE